MSASDLTAFQKELGWFFRDEGFLRMALTHPSVAVEPAAGQQHNQRLEFLGDAVLQLVLTRELYDRFPGLSEGDLTKARARLVKRRTLADLGARLQIGQYLILSRGEELQGGRQRPSALADAFEALLGAIFLDGGFEPVREFVLRHFRQDFAAFTAGVDTENPKGELQELLQAESTEAPQYRLEKISGPDHDRLFECAVFHGEVELGRGQGKSKKAAESEAALSALIALRTQHPPQ